MNLDIKLTVDPGSDASLIHSLAHQQFAEQNPGVSLIDFSNPDPVAATHNFRKFEELLIKKFIQANAKALQQTEESLTTLIVDTLNTDVNNALVKQINEWSVGEKPRDASAKNIFREGGWFRLDEGDVIYPELPEDNKNRGFNARDEGGIGKFIEAMILGLLPDNKQKADVLNLLEVKATSRPTTVFVGGMTMEAFYTENIKNFIENNLLPNPKIVEYIDQILSSTAIFLKAVEKMANLLLFNIQKDVTNRLTEKWIKFRIEDILIYYNLNIKSLWARWVGGWGPENQMGTWFQFGSGGTLMQTATEFVKRGGGEGYSSTATGRRAFPDKMDMFKKVYELTLKKKYALPTKDTSLAFREKNNLYLNFVNALESPVLKSVFLTALMEIQPEQSALNTDYAWYRRRQK